MRNFKITNFRLFSLLLIITMIFGLISSYMVVFAGDIGDTGPPYTGKFDTNISENHDVPQSSQLPPVQSIDNDNEKLETTDNTVIENDSEANQLIIYLPLITNDEANYTNEGKLIYEGSDGNYYVYNENTGKYEMYEYMPLIQEISEETTAVQETKPPTVQTPMTIMASAPLASSSLGQSNDLINNLVRIAMSDKDDSTAVFTIGTQFTVGKYEFDTHIPAALPPIIFIISVYDDKNGGAFIKKLFNDIVGIVGENNNRVKFIFDTGAGIDNFGLCNLSLNLISSVALINNNAELYGGGNLITAIETAVNSQPIPGDIFVISNIDNTSSLTNAAYELKSQINTSVTPINIYGLYYTKTGSGSTTPFYDDVPQWMIIITNNGYIGYMINRDGYINGNDFAALSSSLTNEFKEALCAESYEIFVLTDKLSHDILNTFDFSNISPILLYYDNSWKTIPTDGAGGIGSFDFNFENGEYKFTLAVPDKTLLAGTYRAVFEISGGQPGLNIPTHDDNTSATISWKLNGKSSGSIIQADNKPTLTIKGGGTTVKITATFVGMSVGTDSLKYVDVVVSDNGIVPKTFHVSLNLFGGEVRTYENVANAEQYTITDASYVPYGYDYIIKSPDVSTPGEIFLEIEVFLSPQPYFHSPKEAACP